MSEFEIKQGDIVKGIVTRVETDAAFIDFGYKTEGQIARSQWSAVSGPSLTDMAQIGETVTATVLAVSDTELPRLSRKGAVTSVTWQELRAASEQGTVFAVTVLSAVKGGLVADVQGIRAFLPASLIDLKFVGDLSAYVFQKLSVVITEVDEEEKRIILSRKQIVEQEEAELRKGRLQEFAVGEKRTGTVVRFTPFGAFIDLGGVDGLLHVSEMSWSRIASPEEALTVGQEVQVQILRIDAESGKISLSMKDAAKSPWSEAASQFHEGDIIKGTVKRLSTFGAFIEVAPGVEGLVHVSQISTKRVTQPSDVLQPGQIVQVKILELKPAEERMSLSIREAIKKEDKQRVSAWTEKQTNDTPSPTLGDLFGDLLRDKFK